MRSTVLRSSIAAAAIGMIALTGCQSSGWSVPGASMLSWNKKKPSTSTVQGNRPPNYPLQPPSVNMQPYQTAGNTQSQTPAYGNTPANPYASYGAAANYGTAGGANPASQYNTGQYSVNTPSYGAAPASYGAAGGTSTYGAPAGYGAATPSAAASYTADTRSGYGAGGAGAGYGAGAGSSGYGARTGSSGYGAAAPADPMSGYGAQSPYGGAGGVTTPPSSPYGGGGSTSGYPGMDSGSSAPAYPSTPSYNGGASFAPGSTNHQLPNNVQPAGYSDGGASANGGSFSPSNYR